MELAKVLNGIDVSKTPLPEYLIGLSIESLQDLSWTDPALGVSNAAWWPIEESLDSLNEYEKYGQETLTPVESRKVVLLTRKVEPFTESEINNYRARKAEQIKNEVVSSCQKRLDDFARTRNYDSILSLCTYASSPSVKFKAEGQYGVDARDATWTKLYEILAEVEAATRPMPTGYAEIEPELPTLAWPI